MLEVGSSVSVAIGSHQRISESVASRATHSFQTVVPASKPDKQEPLNDSPALGLQTGDPAQACLDQSSRTRGQDGLAVVAQWD